MDTGNNGQMLSMNVESIAEVKVLTQGYQAEYGRSSGLQITAVTKSGTNRFRGSAYDYKINSDWNENSWVNQAKNGDPKPVNKRDIYGYSHRRSGRQAGRQQQAVLLLLARVPSDQRGDQRRQPDPPPRPDRARARRRLLADAATTTATCSTSIRDCTTQRAPARRPTPPAASRTAASSAGSRRTGSYPTGVALLNALSAAERRAGGRHELQLPGQRRRR